MKRRIAVAVLLALAGVACARGAYGATLAEARSKAIAWLERNQNSNGSWGSGQLRWVATTEALGALVAAAAAESPPGSSQTVAIQRAKGWLLNHQTTSLDARARTIWALAKIGILLGKEAQEIETSANNASGWGVVLDAGATSYDSALVLAALKPIGIGITNRAQKLDEILNRRRYDHGWSGDGIPDTGDAPSDRTTTAEIARALYYAEPTLDLAASRLFLSSGGLPVPMTDASLELSSRLAAIHTLGFTDSPIETELLRDGRLTGGVWSATDPLVNARGLLAVTTKPGVTFSSSDFDGDGVPNSSDAFPHDALEQMDRDGDGVGDNLDLDDDGDGVPDSEELFPIDPTEWVDSDADGIGDNADLDDDGDGVADLDEYEDGSHPLRVDSDGDLFADGPDGFVEVAEIPEGWNLDNDGFVDGEAGISDPADSLDHPGKPGDLAPLGHPDARIGVADAAVIGRLLGDPSLVESIAGTDQNRRIAEEALDANQDERFDAGDALTVFRQLEP